MPDDLLSDEYPRAVWRVITHRAANGPLNMAIDEAIAGHVSAGRAAPTLRFYGWEPACLSLGYAQAFADVDAQRMRMSGWDIVRRLTGGRAILHVDELTYSIAVPDGDPRVAGGVVESYRRLSRGLVLGLEELGAAIQSDRAAQGAHDFKGPVCFEVPSDYEITVQGRKLLGSAQTRRQGGIVLQHGALPLFGDVARICDVLVFGGDAERAEARRRVLERAITLEEALGQRVGFGHVAGALRRGFERALNLELEADDLSAEEQTQAAELMAARYAREAWTQRH
jgi:lipoate-protein ligase A